MEGEKKQDKQGSVPSKTQQVECCDKCREVFYYNAEDCTWDESSSHCSVKLIQCPHCGTQVVIRTVFDSWFLVETGQKG